MELKLYDIKETNEFKSLLEIGCSGDKYIKAADNTYRIISKKMYSNLELQSFPSETEFIALVLDAQNNLVLISLQSYYKMMIDRKTIDVKILEISPHLKGTEYEEDAFNLFKFRGINDEEKCNRKLLWLCKVSKVIQSKSNYKGITSDYTRQLVTHYMNDLSYGLYSTYGLDFNVVSKILTTRESYLNMDKAIEVIVVGETIRKVGDECYLYYKIPKYKFVSTYIGKNMSVNEIIRVFESKKKHLVHKTKLEEFIKGKEVMVDFKESGNPIMSVAFLN